MPIQFKEQIISENDDTLSNRKELSSHRDASHTASRMKKAKSVDFGRFLQQQQASNDVKSRSGSGDEYRWASKFSRNAARSNAFYGSHSLANDDDFMSTCMKTTSSNSSNLCTETDRSRIEADNDSSLTVWIPIGPLTLGKLSVLVLLLATVMEVFLRQVHRSESPEMYDNLGTDVIRPAFRYKSIGFSRNRASLGSAAIASVTEALSPILPFTGGLDLRREDYWSTPGNWVQKFQSVATQVKDAFSQQDALFHNNDSTSDHSVKGDNLTGRIVIQPVPSRRKVVSYISTISASQPFVSVETIAEMTLSDVSEIFRYSLECNKDDFDEGQFLSTSLPLVKDVVNAIQNAMIKSRGSDVKISPLAENSVSGSIDALAFSAAMRVFAEWRIIRQVPEGYKGFAVGMNLGYKDILQNVAKIESTVHVLLDHRRHISDEDAELVSPTLREVLEFEIEMDLNPLQRLPRLNDKTAAMGLLWVRRQLLYQTLLFDNLLEIPIKFTSTPEAVGAAYQSTYDKYHGWAVQKIFNYSFQSAPTAEEIYKHMNPKLLHRVTTIAEQSSVSDGLKVSEIPILNSSLDKNDNPLDAFIKHVGGEWDKFVHSLEHFFNHKREESKVQRETQFDAAAIEQFITTAMIKDAHKRISEYLTVVNPLLDNLAALYDQLNMDDPTKV